MNKLEFNFSDDGFNRLFPFYILIDESLQIKSFGKSLAKIYPFLEKSASFTANFTITRPHLISPSFEELVLNINQLTVIKSTKNDISIRGQFEKHDKCLIFVGSPWFNSMNDVVEKKLTIHDFALHDPLIDLLHVLNNQENTSKELKELLVVINNQKNKLRKDGEELNRLSLVASANANGVVFTEPTGEIIWCNDAYLNLTGFSKEEVIGQTPIQVGKCDETSEKETLKMTIPFFKGDIFDVEHLHRRKEGSSFWVKTKGQPILNTKGEVKQYFAEIEDITEKKEAEFKLLEANSRLNSLILNLQTGIVLEDENGKVLLANKKFCLMLGYKKEPESLTGASLLSSIEESKIIFKNSELYVNRIKEILKKNEIVTNEELYLEDGRIFERSYIPIFRNGIYKGNLRSYVDITLKKNYEENLKIEKAKYQNIIANMNLGLLEVDKEGKILLANNCFCIMSGYSLEELKGKNASDLFLNKTNEEPKNSKEYLYEKGQTDSYEIKVINKNQKKRHWLISGVPNIDINGNTIGTIGIHLDVTEQKEQEEQLYLLSLIAEKNLNAVVISDKEGNIEWANKSFIEMSGYEFEEIIGQKPGYLLQGKETNLETIAYLKDKIAKGLPFNCEIINYAKNGNKYWVSINGQALYNKKGEIIKYFAIEENITTRKEFEEQREFLVDSLAKSNKELEEYASIVSHDLKSPLRSIHSLISWIKEDNDKEFSNKTFQYLSMVEDKVEKMDHLIEGILTYAKIDKVDKVIENVNTQEIVQNIIKIIHVQSHVELSIKNPLPIINADRFRIQQLFQNLISNAVNYNDKPSGFVYIDCKETPEDYIFTIEDNGPGIAKQNQEKIFKIFQSLETSDKSTGIGLSIVKKIVESYNGEIWLESKIGKGTTFFIKFKK